MGGEQIAKAAAGVVSSGVSSGSLPIGGYDFDGPPVEATKADSSEYYHNKCRKFLQNGPTKEQIAGWMREFRYNEGTNKAIENDVDALRSVSSSMKYRIKRDAYVKMRVSEFEEEAKNVIRRALGL